MATGPLKILFLGDYSGFHLTLARRLRAMGHECTVASNGSAVMDTSRDIDIKRRPGAINSVKYLLRIMRLVPQLRGYDIVQLVNPGFLSLRPERLRYFFDKIKKQNGYVGLSLCGSDSFVVQDSIEGNLFRYSEYNLGRSLSDFSKTHHEEISQWTHHKLTSYCGYIYNNVDLALSALYEYHKVGEHRLHDVPLKYIGIPVDTDEIEFEGLKSDGDRPLRILVGIKSEYADFKGTGRLLDAAREAERRFPEKCVVDVARDMPLTDYLERLRRADVVVDQLYSYTPATNALQAMAMGKIVISGAEPEFYDFIGEEKLRPVINAVPDDRKLVEIFENLVNLPHSKLTELSETGRRFVERHNSAQVVADRFIEGWEKVMA